MNWHYNILYGNLKTLVTIVKEVKELGKEGAGCSYYPTKSLEILKNLGIPVSSDGLCFMLKIAVCIGISLEGIVNV